MLFRRDAVMQTAHGVCEQPKRVCGGPRRDLGLLQANPAHASDHMTHDLRFAVSGHHLCADGFVCLVDMMIYLMRVTLIAVPLHALCHVPRKCFVVVLASSSGFV